MWAFGNKYSAEAVNKGGQYFLIGRVTNVVLGPYKGASKEIDPDYSSPADIGKIQYQLLYSPLGKRRSKQTSDTGNKPAYPMSGFLKQYPVIGEIVLIITGPSPGLNDDYNNQRLYYFPPYSLWNDSNHNGFPDLEEYAEFINTTANEPGYSGTISTGSNMPLGYTFDEKFVRNLQPFEGDIIFQSRFGQSIRFGSTVPVLRTQNTWSDSGNNGDPITIITNQQANRAGQYKFDTTVENINRDGSSIWMTSNQQVNIELTSFPLNSFKVSIKPTTQTLVESSKPPVSNFASSAKDQDTANPALTQRTGVEVKFRTVAVSEPTEPVIGIGVGSSMNYSVAKQIARSNAVYEITKKLNTESLQGSFIIRNEKAKSTDSGYEVEITIEYIPPNTNPQSET